MIAAIGLLVGGKSPELFTEPFNIGILNPLGLIGNIFVVKDISGASGKQNNRTVAHNAKVQNTHRTFHVFGDHAVRVALGMS